MSERESSKPGRPGDPEDPDPSGAWRASGWGERIVALWPGASPPDGFASEVIGAAMARANRQRPRTRRIAAGLIALAAAGAVVLLVLANTGDRQAELVSGARVTERRETLRIGTRAVAVAEPGAALAWRPDRGTLAVDQSRGSVFFRVDRGRAPFAVVTSAGRVDVLGTCFRVEVTGGVMTVAVYEGTVTAENERGRARVTAGERAVVAPDGPPRIGPIPALAAAEPALPPAPAGATPAELLAREQAYRGQIGALRQRVAELETSLAATPGALQPGEPPRDKYDGFTPDELLWMARRCELRYDLPGYAYQLDHRISAARAAALGLSDAEREAIDRINREGDARLLEQTRDLYVELTGDRAVAEALEPRTLQHEIFLKSRPGDEVSALQQLSAERAGLARPPPDLSSRPPVERLLRLLVVSGDQYQERLAAVLGAQRAAQLRHTHVGMGLRSGAGCPDN